MELKALIFDVDGTLADTEDAHRLAFNDAFNDAGYGWTWDRGLYRDLLAVTGGRQRIRHFLELTNDPALDDPEIGEIIPRLHREKTAHFVKRLEGGEVPLRQGIEDLLLEARDRGIRLAIATTTSPVNVETLIRVNLGDEALGWFEVIGDGGKVPVLKPEPDVYNWVLQQMNLAPTDALALEDSHNGVVACNRAGVPVVVVSNDYTLGHDFTGALAELETYSGLGLGRLQEFFDGAGK